MSADPKPRRRRGAVFTIMVLVTSAVLLSVGGALVDSTRNLTKHAGLADQQEQAKLALAGTAEWARAEASTWKDAQGSPEKRSTTATLKLSRATVVVKLEPTEAGLAGDAVATVHPDVKMGASLALALRDGRWVVTRFELKP